jgi:RND superfamily putative drug exporter
MHLFGRANWWLPGWLDRVLPHVSIEPSGEPAAKAGPAADEVAPVEPAIQQP